MIEPIDDRVLVRAAEKEVTKGGVHLPDSARKATSGIVVAVGPGFKLQTGGRSPMACKAEDTVLFKKGAGVAFDTGEEELLSLREGELIARLGK